MPNEREPRRGSERADETHGAQQSKTLYRTSPDTGETEQQTVTNAQWRREGAELRQQGWQTDEPAGDTEPDSEPIPV